MILIHKWIIVYTLMIRIYKMMQQIHKKINLLLKNNFYSAMNKITFLMKLQVKSKILILKIIKSLIIITKIMSLMLPISEMIFHR